VFGFYITACTPSTDLVCEEPNQAQSNLTGHTILECLVRRLHDTRQHEDSCLSFDIVRSGIAALVGSILAVINVDVGGRPLQAEQSLSTTELSIRAFFWVH